MAWKYFGPGSPLNTRPDRQTGSMADWKQWVDGLSRYERDQLYPGMHIDLIPAFEKIEGMEEIKNGSQSTPTPLLSPAYSSAAIGQAIMQPPAFTFGNQAGMGKFEPANQPTWFADNLAFQGTTETPYAFEAPPEIIENKRDGPYSPDEPGWHEYRLTNRVAESNSKVSVSQMKDFIRRFAFPGQDSRKPVSDVSTNMVHDTVTGQIDGGLVLTEVLGNGLQIRNRTKPGHIFHDGQIVRTASQSSNGAWSIETHGTGNNASSALSWLNKTTGPILFNHLDMKMYIYIVRALQRK